MRQLRDRKSSQRIAVAEVLRSHGLHVVEAADGAEGLERLAMCTDIALVITDVEMPRMGGLELISRLRARPERRVPAIVVSTRDRDEDKQAAIGVGAGGIAGQERSDAGQPVGPLIGPLRRGLLVIRIVIVDDSPFVREVLRARLARFSDLAIVGEAGGWRDRRAHGGWMS